MSLSFSSGAFRPPVDPSTPTKEEVASLNWLVRWLFLECVGVGVVMLVFSVWKGGVSISQGKLPKGQIPVQCCQGDGPRAQDE